MRLQFAFWKTDFQTTDLWSGLLAVLLGLALWMGWRFIRSRQKSTPPTPIIQQPPWIASRGKDSEWFLIERLWLGRAKLG